MQFPLIPSLWFALIFGLLPGLLALAFTIRSKNNFIAAGLGAIGWFVALQLRLPILQWINTLTWLPNYLLIIGMVAALLAGLFEEIIRYLIILKRQSIWTIRKSLISFGLGWGVCEAILLFGLAIISSILVIQETDPILAATVVPLIGVSLGAIERNIAICLHFALTIIASAAVQKKRYLGVAIFYHFFANFAIVLGLVISLDPYLLEGVFAAMTFFVLGHAMNIWLNHLKPAWRKIEAESSSSL